MSNQPGTGQVQKRRTWDQAPMAFGGVIASPASLFVSLTGPEDHAVIITGLDLRVYGREKPSLGSIVNVTDGGCGGNDIETRYAAVDLDSSPPYYLQPPELLSPATSLLRFPYTVTNYNPEQFQVDVFTRHCRCSWDAVLHWVDGAASGEEVIDNNGRPFVMTPSNGLSAYVWSPIYDEEGTETAYERDSWEVPTNGPIWER